MQHDKLMLGKEFTMSKRPSSWGGSVKSGQSRSSLFYTSKKYGADEKGTNCWRRLVEIAQRHDLTASEMVAQWGCERSSMSYSEFMRGLVAVLGPNSTAFTHSERKRLFESLKQNRDGQVELVEFAKRIADAEAFLQAHQLKQQYAQSSMLRESAQPTSQWTAARCHDDTARPPVTTHRCSTAVMREVTSLRSLQEDAQLSSRSSARHLWMRYRRERLLAANLALRTAMLDRRPLLCSRVPDSTYVVSETTVVVGNTEITGNSLIWTERATNSTVATELELPLSAPAYGVSGCIVSYGETRPLIFAEGTGLVWTALRCVYSELDLLRTEKTAAATKLNGTDDFLVVSIAFEELGLTSSLVARNLHWIALPEHDVEMAVSQARQLAAPLLDEEEDEEEEPKTLIARLKVEDRRYAGAIAELRLIRASPADFDEINIDDSRAWFLRTKASSTQTADRRPLSDCAHSPVVENSFAYCIVHAGDRAVSAQLTSLNKRRETSSTCGHYNRISSAHTSQQLPLQRAAESALPLEALKWRKAVGSKLKQHETERQLVVAEAISNAVKRIAVLDARLRGPLDEADGEELTKITTSSDYANKIGDAYRRQRLAAWERASRLQAALGRIQVVCRIRPLLGADADRGPPPEVKQRMRSHQYTFVKRSGKGRLVSLNLDGHKFATKSRTFEFDDVWDEHTSQEEVCESVENLANDALCGRTASVFAYGCTGGGKSYTVVGDLHSRPPRLGIAFQSVELLLATLKQQSAQNGATSSAKQTLTLSIIEVHNEEVYDLLKKDDCTLAEAHIAATANSVASSCGLVVNSVIATSPGATPHIGQTVAPGFSPTAGGGAASGTAHQLGSLVETSSCASDDARSSISFQTSEAGRSRRRGHHISSASSDHGSTGHVIGGTSSWRPGEKIKLDVRLGPGGKALMPELTRLSIDDMSVFLRVFESGNRRRATTATLLNDASSRSHVVMIVEAPGGGRLCLVDLAGCERVAKSGASGDALKEATCINKSLSALGDCFEAIDKRRRHVPYRNSKLTFMLQDVIGGSASRCLFVFAASPAWATVPETLSSFKFAARLSSIQLDGELLSDKQKQLDSILSLVGERIERRLLATFQDELRDVEERSLAKLVHEQEEEAQLRACEQQRLEDQRSRRLLLINSPHDIGADCGSSSAASPAADVVVSALPGTLAEGLAPEASFEQPVETTNCVDDALSWTSERDKKVDSELATLWRRLRATEHELARLSVAAQNSAETLLAPPQKVERPKAMPRRSAQDCESFHSAPPGPYNTLQHLESPCEDERLFGHTVIDIDEVSSAPPSATPSEVDYCELTHPAWPVTEPKSPSINVTAIAPDETLDDDEPPTPPLPPPDDDESDNTVSRVTTMQKDSGQVESAYCEDDGIDQLISEPDNETAVAIKVVFERGFHDEGRAIRNIALDIVADDALPARPGCVFSLFNMLFCEAESAEAESTGLNYSDTSTPDGGCKVVVGIHRATGLLAPDRNFSTALVGASTNPYIVCKYGEEEQVTSDVVASVNPAWDVDLVFRYREHLPCIFTLYLFSTNAYLPDTLLGKVVIDLKSQLDFHSFDHLPDYHGGKARLLMPKTWHRVQPCFEDERNLLKHIKQDKAFGFHFRSQRFLFGKSDLGLVQISAFSLHLDS